MFKHLFILSNSSKQKRKKIYRSLQQFGRMLPQPTGEFNFHHVTFHTIFEWRPVIFSTTLHHHGSSSMVAYKTKVMMIMPMLKCSDSNGKLIVSLMSSSGQYIALASYCPQQSTDVGVGIKIYGNMYNKNVVLSRNFHANRRPLDNQVLNRQFSIITL